MKKFVLSTLAISAIATSANAAIVAGDLAIIARTNNGSPDSFSIVTLAPIGAGEVVYFTDNGWQTAGQFRTGSTTDGDGNENLMKITFNNAVAAGSIISSTATGNPNYTWATSGTIGTTASGTYQQLSQGQGGEQIYAFQNTDLNNPLNTPLTLSHIFVFDDTNGFETATDSSTGAIPPGLSVAGGTVAGISAAVGGTVTFNTGVIASGTKTQWLTEIANPVNWSAGSQPTGSISVIPEPTTLCTFGLAAMAGLRRSRRK